MGCCPHHQSIISRKFTESIVLSASLWIGSCQPPRSDCQ